MAFQKYATLHRYMGDSSVDIQIMESSGIQYHGEDSMKWIKHVRCNPDVGPCLTSGGYEDKVDVTTPINILFIGGWRILIPYEDKVDVYPNQHIVHKGGEF